MTLEPLASAVVELREPSTAIGRTKAVNVLLPRDYREDGPRLPVLYLLHGFGGNRKTWLTGTGLADHASRQRMIVVLPESGRNWFVNDHGGRRYEDYLLEVVELIDARFPTIAERGGRGIGGFSMGGAAALFQTLRHPTLFSMVVAAAGAFEAPSRVGDPYQQHRHDPGFVMPSVEIHERVWGPPGSATRRKYDPYRLIDGFSGPRPSIRLDIGLDDYPRMIEMNRSVHAALRTACLDPEYRESPGGHDWDFVDSVLPGALDFAARCFAGRATVASTP